MVQGLQAQQDTVVDQFGDQYLPELESPLSNDSLVEQLRAVLVLENAESVQMGPLDLDPGIYLGGFRDQPLPEREMLPQEVIEVIKQHVGKPVSLTSLDALVRDTVMAYHKLGHEVDIQIPEQDITKGTIQILLTAGRFAGGNVRPQP